MKVTIVSAVLNEKDFIASCMESVLGQDYHDIEYIIVDGASTDGTIDIIKHYSSRVSNFLSENDNGFYDALNKGIRLATGDIIGQLNADDILADPSVVSRIVKEFKKGNCSGVYGNLDYTRRNNLDIIVRKWHSGPFKRQSFESGWMPPHPALYLKKGIYEQYGNYNIAFGSSADYEFMLRLFYRYGITARFADTLFVKMRVGGISTAGWRQFFKVFVQDYKALTVHGVNRPIIAVVLKKSRKIFQFLASYRKHIIRNF